jgi:hypothetical protein
MAPTCRDSAPVCLRVPVSLRVMAVHLAVRSCDRDHICVRIFIRTADNSAGSATTFEGHSCPCQLLPVRQPWRPATAELGADAASSPGSFVVRFLSGGSPLGPASWHPERRYPPRHHQRCCRRRSWRRPGPLAGPGAGPGREPARTGGDGPPSGPGGHSTPCPCGPSTGDCCRRAGEDRHEPRTARGRQADHRYRHPGDGR